MPMRWTVAMVGFEQVCVVEVMGRHAGWLVAVATTLQQSESVVVTLLPELPLQWDRLLTVVEQRFHEKRPVLIAVGEGVSDEQGLPIAQMQTGSQSAQMMLGGIGRHIAGVMRAQLGCGVRAENLGLLQRCLALSATSLNVAEARRLGSMAAGAALRGEGGHMIGFAPRGWEAREVVEPQLIALPLEQVAAQERVLPLSGGELSSQFGSWVTPLLSAAALATHPRLQSFP